MLNGMNGIAEIHNYTFAEAPSAEDRPGAGRDPSQSTCRADSHFAMSPGYATRFGMPIAFYISNHQNGNPGEQYS